MEECKDCRNGIINGQESLIGNPECHDNCGSETDCEGIQTYSDCVGVNPALPCIDTSANTSLSDVLVALDTKLCQTQQSSCTVSVDANDTCCRYLGDKLIAGTGVTITKNIATASSGCKTLTISTNPATLVWNNIVLPANLSTIPGFQPPQYSNKDELNRVWFRGSFNFTTTIPTGTPVNFSTILPANSRPALNRLFYSGRSAGNGSTSLEIVIQSNGIMYVKNTSNLPTSNKGQVSLDGFWIDTNA